MQRAGGGRGNICGKLWVWVSGICAPPRGKRAAPPRKKNKSWPALPRPAKIGKSCGAGRGKVDLNPLKI